MPWEDTDNGWGVGGTDIDPATGGAVELTDVTGLTFTAGSNTTINSQSELGTGRYTVDITTSASAATPAQAAYAEFDISGFDATAGEVIVFVVTMETQPTSFTNPWIAAGACDAGGVASAAAWLLGGITGRNADMGTIIVYNSTVVYPVYNTSKADNLKSVSTLLISNANGTAPFGVLNTSIKGTQSLDSWEVATAGSGAHKFVVAMGMTTTTSNESMTFRVQYYRLQAGTL